VAKQVLILPLLEMSKPWRKRLNISVDEGNDNFVFLSKSGLHLAIGYTRVVIGKRGPYVEFFETAH